MFFGCFANVCLQRMKIDQANKLVEAAVAQVWAPEFAVSAPSLYILVTVLIFFVEQDPGRACLGTLVKRIWLQGRGVGGRRRGARH